MIKKQIQKVEGASEMHVQMPCVRVETAPCVAVLPEGPFRPADFEAPLQAYAFLCRTLVFPNGFEQERTFPLQAIAKYHAIDPQGVRILQTAAGADCINTHVVEGERIMVSGRVSQA